MQKKEPEGRERSYHTFFFIPFKKNNNANNNICSPGKGDSILSYCDPPDFPPHQRFTFFFLFFQTPKMQNTPEGGSITLRSVSCLSPRGVLHYQFHLVFFFFFR